MRYGFGCLIALLLLSPPASANDDAWANTFFPQSLVQGSVAAGGNVRLWSTAPVTFGSTPYLAIAYSNGISGVLRILRINGEAASLVSERTDLDGSAPGLETPDIDNDHVPEIVVSFRTGRRGERTSYVYRWNGSAIAPLLVDDSGRDGGFLNSSFLDIDGDGVLEVVEPKSTAGDDEVSGTIGSGFDTYKLINGSLLLQTQITTPYVGLFIRGTGAPKTISEDVTADPGAYVLRISNGDQTGHLVDSAEIRLNGVVILGPSQFKPTKQTISLPVTLTALNTISVELRSAPKTRMTITLSRSTVATP